MKNIDYALKLCNAGMYVLPMHEKQPMITFADKPALTKEEIKFIWEKYPNANIAVRTVDFFVVDIDQHPGGRNGMESIKTLNKKYPNTLKPTLMQKTAHDGLQLFYKKPKKIKVHQVIGWLPGVDIKAHVNNYVVVAPSKLGDKQYKFTNKLPISEPTEQLVKLIKKVYDKNHDISPDKPNGQMTETGVVQKTRTTKLFEIIANGLGGQGERNDTLTTLIGGLFYRGVEIDEAYNLSLIANKNSYDPLPESEIIKTFTSVQKRESKRREYLQKKANKKQGE